MLLNLKNNYLLKKQFKGADKKQKNFNIYNVEFKKIKIKQNNWRYHCFTPVYQKPWLYDLQFQRYRADFILLPPAKSEKSEFWWWWWWWCISSFYTCTPKFTIYDKHVAEIQSETDRIFGHFGPFFALSLSNKPENQNFEKLKKAPEDVTILHLCTKNYDHMMYASWDKECERHNLLSFWAIFCSYTT